MYYIEPRGWFERIGYDVICSLCYTFVPKHIATNVSYAALLLYLLFILFPMCELIVKYNFKHFSHPYVYFFQAN